MPSKEFHLLDNPDNVSISNKCESCNKFLDDTSFFPLEKVNELDHDSISRLIGSTMSGPNNKDIVHNNISKNLEISTKHTIISLVFIIVVILFNVVLTGNALLLILTYLPLLYILYRSMKVSSFKKYLIKEAISFKPNIEEFTINLNQKKSFIIRSAIILDKNAFCLICEEKLAKSNLLDEK